jgi:hypothetical protein
VTEAPVTYATIQDLLVFEDLDKEITPEILRAHVRLALVDVVGFRYSGLTVIAKDLTDLISRRDDTYTASVGYEMDVTSSEHSAAVAALNSMVDAPQGSTTSPLQAAFAQIDDGYAAATISRDPSYSRVQTELSSGNQGSDDDSSGSSNAGLIAGIVIAVIIVLIALGVATAYVKKHGHFMGFSLDENAEDTKEEEFANPMYMTKKRGVGFDNTTYDALDAEETV